MNFPYFDFFHIFLFFARRRMFIILGVCGMKILGISQTSVSPAFDTKLA